MTWIGRGMLNLAMNRIDQARFFFEQLTLRECGEILPALIGMAAVKYMEKDYTGAQDLYARSMTKFPVQSGAATRVGFGMACYKLGQMDRAKAAFRRAQEMDPENVEALVGIAVLEMASLDDVLDPREYRAEAENVIKMISMANLVDHTNAMVQNHLANHYFWKWTPKDYDRVLSLAKGAYNATNIPEMQAESLYMLARVYHARGEMELANKFYDKACKHSPELSPARFGLAQTLIWDEAYDEAAAHLRLLLGTCSNATDALAALGLLEVKGGKDRREAFIYLKKAIDLDPFNADLVLIEALALQQNESDYLLSLDRYRKAVRLLEAQQKIVPADVLTNMGALHIHLKSVVALNEGESAISVKKSNGRLRNASSISVAFNLARLHEAAGRIVPAVELHKAIVKRHPSYVNSYLRLACIARDCGSLKDCSEWLKSAVAVAPGNPEVLTLVGNLHLSLCDWAPAQKVFDQLLIQKVPKVEAYSMLSLGNIYFNNLNTPKKYSKHLQHAADFYRRILSKDNANAYAANGLGTVLAERGELFKAKEVFNRVREVSGDTILDCLLNLGHIYLAQKKHSEALQMYQSYMNRTRASDDDEAEVLLYIAFAYFDWARQTEFALSILKWQWVEARRRMSPYDTIANCVLQKVNRNIRRTAQEVKYALDGLEESLAIVQTMLQWKSEGKKVTVPTGMLTDFASQCKHNIDSAKSHLNEELKKEKEAQVLRDFQRIEAEATEKQRQLTVTLQKEKEAQEAEERDRKARQKMDQVTNLVDGWKQAAVAAEKAPRKKGAGAAPPGGVDHEAGIFDTEVPATSTAALFDDESDDEEEDEGAVAGTNTNEASKPDELKAQEKDLFGDSSSDEDEEKTKKRSKDYAKGWDDAEDEQASKKRKVEEEEA
ncbi:hypothetical protein THAPSDRAFT_268346 [Thalassiosira pseudonana CCMP1335]|uniref:RNA polymerase-associated protein CTR9 n=1 Tax=Thalassiosira pseudonana TaxID=35128 RepID=B8BVF7_THAPS|nr:hypothetical protein THAPSDRAFT_268346 [Thalassiosira pseudonana CCMP1335]EED94926.1 hypothetical protein THAPSDRAFT_268346 [Thalassiosira pseudonana CCMP1335]